MRDPDYSMGNSWRRRLSFPPPRKGWLRDIVRIDVREADYIETGALPFSSTRGWPRLEQHWRRD